MKCPKCHHDDTRVFDSRPTENGMAIRRRRECPECGFRFTTYERWEEPPLMVVKKDGRRERFDRNKLLSGILKAVEKRPVSSEAIERIISNIESQIADRVEREVPSKIIGELVMEHLKQLDHVAYVRFASVYRSFREIDDFIREIEQLLSERKREGKKKKGKSVGKQTNTELI